MRKEIKIDKFLDGTQRRANIMKETTVTDLINCIGNKKRKRKGVKTVEATAKIVPMAVAKKNPVIILKKE